MEEKTTGYQCIFNASETSETKFYMVQHSPTQKVFRTPWT